MREDYQTIRTRWEDDLCFLQFYRPHDRNTINSTLVQEFLQVLQECEAKAKVIIVEGSEKIFCFGLDFNELRNASSQAPDFNPEPLYNLWLQLTQGSFISIAHVQGKANAGGVGFVAACDLVFANKNAVFSLSELLFGLMPACVLPFLIRKIGLPKSHAMTLMTKPITAEQAFDWGLVDKYGEDSSALLHRELRRLKYLNKTAISRYKRYINTLDTSVLDHKSKALAANLEVFTDVENRHKIVRYLETGKFPWEKD